MNADTLVESYADAKPWPHMVIDGFLPYGLADQAADAFPEADDEIWRRYGREFKNGHARKLEMAKVSAMPAELQNVVVYTHALAMVRRIRRLTGFDDLTPDDSLYGGGLNLVEPGGFLEPHADWNWNDKLRRYRTANLIVYLRKGWSSGDGGELELWSGGKCAKKIEPRFNRAVLFTCTQDAVHGYGPVNNVRKSLSLYFYRHKPAPGIAAQPHRTLWKAA